MTQEQIFNEKINHFSKHTKFQWLREYADEALKWNTMCGFYQIKAEDFIERIVAAPLEYIEDWLNENNQLEWSGIKSK